ncbi:MAG: Gfo/Idh/MocA family oxidoreductase [Muribaculaceae bacterium]|nr:Gfo/Idh/MocA family oxidoreductase [Muribaculaceae bacterium]
MKKFLDNAIQRWCKLRNRKMLQSPYSSRYAFVGVGSHALQNLYPVLQYLGIRLKYVCCKSPDKLELIELRFNVVATASLDTILNDSDVKGVFVCLPPETHYDICTRVISSGKYLFVEKPPCRTLQQLEALIEADAYERVMVGMQKRYSPLTQTLRRRLSKSRVISYTLSYHTGAYPEGEPLTDLFIHPVDMAAYLFGEAQKISVQRTGQQGTVTLQALLSHGNVNGIIELSTAYSWANPEELLRVNTGTGEYRLEQMECLTFNPHPKRIAGIPVEKLGLFTTSEQILMERNNFTPLIVNNQLYTQGFFSEIKAFAEMVEFGGKNVSTLSDMRTTYTILEFLRS